MHGSRNYTDHCKLYNTSFIKFLSLKMVILFDILNGKNLSVEFKLKLYVKTSIQTSRKNNGKHEARMFYLQVIRHCVGQILKHNSHHISCSVGLRKTRSRSEKSRKSSCSKSHVFNSSSLKVIFYYKSSVFLME